MLIRGLLFVAGLLLRLLERTLEWVVDALEGLYRLWGLMPILLKTADRLLLAGRDYLRRVGARLRYRVAYENVTDELRRRYRRLRGQP